MAREEFVWEDLTPNEEKVLADLRSKGVKIFAAPIEIEENAESRARQFASLGITWKQVRDYPIGSKKVKVHYVPADEATYHLLTNDLGNKYRDAFRKSRCLIPGTLKPLIRCPDENKCAECPYPDCREKHQANEISYDAIIESGFESGANGALAAGNVDLLAGYSELGADGSTACGMWIYSGFYANSAAPLDPAQQAIGRRNNKDTSGLGLYSD